MASDSVELPYPSQIDTEGQYCVAGEISYGELELGPKALGWGSGQDDTPRLMARGYLPASAVVLLYPAVSWRNLGPSADHPDRAA